MILHQEHASPGSTSSYLPPWRLGICLHCHHCFDMVGLERCPQCECRRAVGLQQLIENWQHFGARVVAAA